MAASNPLWDDVPHFSRGALLSQTCKTNDKVQPGITVGSWQEKRQLAQLGPVQGSVLSLGFVRLCSLICAVPHKGWNPQPHNQDL